MRRTVENHQTFQKLPMEGGVLKLPTNQGAGELHSEDGWNARGVNGRLKGSVKWW